MAATPSGLLADFDGTLSPIVTDPAMARPADGVREALAGLLARGAVVAIITGRASLDARQMLGVPGVLIAGNHGTEWLEPDAEKPISSMDVAEVRAGLDAALGRLPSLPGVPLEDKGLSASIHFRNARDPDAAREAILAALGDVRAEGLDLRLGRMVVELRPIGAADKGTAARHVVERHGLRGVIVLGDDLTDVDMFRAVAEMRAAGRVTAAIIGVGGAGEVPPEIVSAADEMVPSPAAAAELLRAIR